MRCRQPGSIRIHFLLALGAALGVLAGMARELPLGEGVGAAPLEQGTAMLSKPGAHTRATHYYPWKSAHITMRAL